MKLSLKARFWNWIYIKARNLYYYAEQKVNQQHEIDNSIISNPDNESGSNYYPWEKIWEDDDSTLYTWSDGESM